VEHVGEKITSQINNKYVLKLLERCWIQIAFFTNWSMYTLDLANSVTSFLKGFQFSSPLSPAYTNCGLRSGLEGSCMDKGSPFGSYTESTRAVIGGS
jgi:hypothetical protein